ncbi:MULTISPECIES: flagellar motor protein MotB [unclassified Paenibacillus]|uniref:flagellar motor protein MotB n=1 Tax=unclassified Paenibacillus TaxID=185978 RepID=UPI0003E1D38C|nr:MULTISPECIES: flagellar motor protein MotB [unclassified Paenibacillus]ETT50030.1 OmpA/MotB domain-containing protein [Paenibacillus sp. FSL R7-269]OMF88106.1 flagellar motor protein [Paenibacillus sp. FSL R7-0337]
MRQRNRRQPRAAAGKESRDRWMITYADLITLLLIFFVILYAMSSLDSQKYAIVSGSLSDTFKSGSAVLEGGSGVLEGNQGITGAGVSKGHNEDGGDTGAPSATDSADADGLNGTGQTGDGAGHQPSARELAFREQEAKLAALMGVITEYVEENNLGEQIFVADKPQGIAITLSDRFLFDAGKAELKSPAFPALRQLSGLFRGIGATISIEGHTDNVPVTPGSVYKDNWELSGARALSVLRFFLDKEGLSPDTFQYAGYADTRPAYDNTTTEGKQRNRRVELIVLRQLQEKE